MEERVPMTDKILPGDDKLKFGCKVILPCSFVGSPRWYNAQFQDGMAICREYHKPDNFPDGTDEKEQAERLEAIVLANNVHGPCGK